MHKTSYAHMSRLTDKYLDPSAALNIIDLGSFRIDERNLSYRDLLNRSGWNYLGVDIATGPNVDVVLETAYTLPFESESVDLIVCGQVFEHVEFFWLTWAEMIRVLKPGGMVFLIAPSRGFDHKFPVDCWRFYPDSYRALARLQNCDLLEVHTDGLMEQTATDISIVSRIFTLLLFLVRQNIWAIKYFWGDTVGVFKKRARVG